MKANLLATGFINVCSLFLKRECALYTDNHVDMAFYHRNMKQVDLLALPLIACLSCKRVLFLWCSGLHYKCSWWHKWPISSCLREWVMARSTRSLLVIVSEWWHAVPDLFLSQGVSDDTLCLISSCDNEWVMVQSVRSLPVTMSEWGHLCHQK
jgi:hypothetical protein